MMSLVPTISRRAVLGGAGALAAVAGASRAADAEFPEPAYRRAVVIDGLGSLDDPDGAPDATVLTPRGGALLKASGVTVLHTTVNAAGNQPGAWETTVEYIAQVD